MGMWDRVVLRGLRRYIPDESTVLAVEAGRSDALGVTHKVTAVLTSDALLLATPVRARTILTKIARSDIRAVEVVKPAVAEVAFDDYDRAMRRVVTLDLSRRGDRDGIITQVTAAISGE